MRIFCSICKDIFIPYSEVHVTNCGHLYHGSCISTWIRQHRTCPQCRTNLSVPFRVYFDVDKENTADPSTLEHELETVSDKLREAEKQKKNLLEENKNVEKIVEEMKECAVSLSKKNDILKISVKALKEQVAKLTKKTEAVEYLENEVQTWKAKVSKFERVETLLKGSVEEVNKMIEDTPITELATRQLCTYVGALKVQLHKLEEKNFKLLKENRELSKKVSEEKIKYSFDTVEMKNIKEANNVLANELLYLKKLFKDYKVRHPEKKEEMDSSSNVARGKMSVKPSFNIDLEFLNDDNEDKSAGLIQCPLKSDKIINNWEELVCAGPSRNFGLSLKSRTFSKTVSNHKEDRDVARFDEAYAFDGLGGRKKLRLGGPTPLEEFQKIKKKKDKKSSVPNIQHKTIQIQNYFKNC